MMVQKAESPARSGSGKIAQLVLSLLLFAGFVVFLFVPDAALAEQSLFGQLLDLFKGEFFGTDMMKVSLYAVVGMYGVLLVCTVAGFFCKKNGVAALNFVKTLAAVAVTAFYAYELIDTGMGLITASDIFYDAKTYIALNSTCLSMALGLVGMLVLCGVTYKGKGAVKIIYALIAAGFFVFVRWDFVGGASLRSLFDGVEFGDSMIDTISEITFRALAWASLANLALAILFLALPRTAAAEIIRSAVVFVLAAAGLVFSGIQGSFSGLTEEIGTLGFAGLALVQLVVVIIATCVMHAQKKKKAGEAAPAEQPAPAFVFGADDQMAIRGLEAPAQAAEQPAPAAEQTADDASLRDAAEANKAFDDAAQISIDDIAADAAAAEAEAEPEPEPAADDYGDAIRDISPEELVEEKTFDFNQAKYDGKFNREYADFAAQEEQRRKQEQQPYYGQSYGVPPYYGAQNAPSAPAEGQQAYYAAGYIPDPFFSSLTPAEKDEFDRLFISRIYGDNKRLPAYRLGGDNREFFAKIFVFMGRYRNVISDGLLEKIYNYSNSIR